jgi:DNA-binding response OmpR family regulator
MTTVLVIEDDHDTRVTLREVLEAEGFTVLSAANGSEGYNILDKLQSPVVVLLDQNMPLSNGDDFMNSKRRNKRLENVPVIVLSAVNDRLSQLGATEYLKKPIRYSLLTRTIRKHAPANHWNPQSYAS